MRLLQLASDFAEGVYAEEAATADVFVNLYHGGQPGGFMTWEEAARWLEARLTECRDQVAQLHNRLGQSVTRRAILEAAALRPCHITGLHNPDHHIAGVCADQKAAALDGLLELLGVQVAALPHRLHDDCGWCHDIPGQERYRERLRTTYTWAGVEIPEELAEEGSPH